MPDRYGDQPEPDDFGPEYRRRAQAAIDACDLCDHDGQRNGFPCDHIDHRPAAARGMAKIREAMGWDR